MSDQVQEQKERNEQLKAVYEHFGRQDTVVQDALKTYCEREGIDLVTEGDYQDFVYAVKHDERMGNLMPELLAALSKLKYLPEIATSAERKDILAANNAVVTEIAQLIEKHEIPYIMLDNVLTQLGNGFAQAVQQAVTVMNNKTGDVLMHIAQEKFGTKDVHMGHVAAYAEEVFAKK